jgi:hypothetical protein
MANHAVKKAPAYLVRNVFSVTEVVTNIVVRRHGVLKSVSDSVALPQNRPQREARRNPS